MIDLTLLDADDLDKLSRAGNGRSKKRPRQLSLHAQGIYHPKEKSECDIRLLITLRGDLDAHNPTVTLTLRWGSDAWIRPLASIAFEFYAREFPTEMCWEIRQGLSWHLRGGDGYVPSRFRRGIVADFTALYARLNDRISAALPLYGHEHMYGSGYGGYEG